MFLASLQTTPSVFATLPFPKGTGALTYLPGLGIFPSLTFSTVPSELFPQVLSFFQKGQPQCTGHSSPEGFPNPIPIPSAWLPGQPLFPTSALTPILATSHGFLASSLSPHPVRSPSKLFQPGKPPCEKPFQGFPNIQDKTLAPCQHMPSSAPASVLPSSPALASLFLPPHTCARGSWTRCVLLPSLCTSCSLELECLSTSLTWGMSVHLQSAVP